jgi:hypothetical protein
MKDLPLSVMFLSLLVVRHLGLQMGQDLLD